MDELLLWLRATIVGDKAKAEAATAGPWRWTGDYPEGTCPHGYEWTDHGPDLQSGDDYVITTSGYDASGLNIKDVDAEHIAQHDPRDTVARCDAELAILDEHAPVHAWRPFSARPGRGDGEHVGCKKCVTWIEGRIPEREAYPCRTVRLLAQGYRHRPGWKQEWRPE